jgi:hypothetical protein
MNPSTATSTSASASSADEADFIWVFADLLPEEVIDARRGRRVRSSVLLALGVVLLVMIVATVAARIQTSSARGSLASAQSDGQQLRAQQGQYSALVTAQTKAVTIQSQLRALMASDVGWPTLLAALRAAAPARVVVTGITGSVPLAAPGRAGIATGIGVLAGNAKAIGTIALTGSAPDQAGVAAYLEALSEVTGIAVPYPAAITSVAGGVQFSANLLITSPALGGRYTGGQK